MEYLCIYDSIFCDVWILVRLVCYNENATGYFWRSVGIVR